MAYDKECYAIVYALYVFRHLIRDIQFTLRTDHANFITHYAKSGILSNVCVCVLVKLV